GERPWHGEALAVIAAARAKTGDPRAAAENAAASRDDSDKANALAQLASQQARAGERAAAASTLRQALDAASHIPETVGDPPRPSDSRAVALAAIAGAQAEAGMLEEARKTAQG